jgi:hypothetical protein
VLSSLTLALLLLGPTPNAKGLPKSVRHLAKQLFPRHTRELQLRRKLERAEDLLQRDEVEKASQAIARVQRLVEPGRVSSRALKALRERIEALADTIRQVRVDAERKAADAELSEIHAQAKAALDRVGEEIDRVSFYTPDADLHRLRSQLLPAITAAERRLDEVEQALQERLLASYNRLHRAQLGRARKATFEASWQALEVIGPLFAVAMKQVDVDSAMLLLGEDTVTKMPGRGSNLWKLADEAAYHALNVQQAELRLREIDREWTGALGRNRLRPRYLADYRDHVEISSGELDNLRDLHLKLNSVATQIGGLANEADQASKSSPSRPPTSH